MKKTYEKPAIRVVPLRHQTCLLAGSPVQSKFVDDDYVGWDFDGGQ